MNKPFFVHTSGIRNKPRSRLPIHVAGPMDDLFVSGSAVPDGDKVAFDGQVVAMEAAEGMVVSGIVFAKWKGDCRRCVGPATGTIEARVREIFEPDNVDGETYILHGDGFDMEPLVRETVMLELPEAPLCKSDCAGLCPNCGVNRNEAECSCDNEVLDLRWAALDALKDKSDN